MKYFKYPLIVILSLLILYLIVCLIGPKDLNVTEHITVEAPAPIIFSLVNHLPTSEKWNTWSQEDSTMITNYSDITAGIGATSTWTSQSMGNGTQKIIESQSNQKVRTQLNFEGWAGDNFAEFNIGKSSTGHDVSWSFEGASLPLLMRGFAFITGMKKTMSTNYTQGLENIKNMAEQRAVGNYDGWLIKEVDMEEKHFVIHRQEVETTQITQFYSTYLGALFVKVQQAGQQMSGMPCGLFFKNIKGNGRTTDMAAAIPVSHPISIEGTSSYSTPEQEALTLDYYGDYQGTINGHEAIQQYMRDRRYFQDPPIIEEYVTDPSTEKDVDKWLTKITYYYSTSEGQ